MVGSPWARVPTPQEVKVRSNLLEFVNWVSEQAEAEPIPWGCTAAASGWFVVGLQASEVT